MVTYGDMMGLLLCVFVAVVSVSDVRPDAKWGRLASSLQKAFRASDERHAAATLGHAPTSLLGELEAIAFAAPVGDESSDAADSANAGVQIENAPGGVRIEFNGEFAFAARAAELKPPALAIVEQIGTNAAGHHTGIRIAGLAGEATADPWDLSYARARAVKDVLVANGVQPERIQLSASGPLPAGTHSGRQVEILVTTDNASEPPSSPIHRNGEEPTHGG
jgi:flagellar motor protein MotB